MNHPLRILFAAALLILASCSAPEPEEQEDGLFVVVSIPEGLEPLERGAKYEDPLDTALQELGMGEVSGGGTQLGPAAADGRTAVMAVDIDVELVDLERGLPALRAELRKLGAPQGTVLTYEAEGRQVREPL